MTTTTLDIHISHRVAVVWMARETVRNAFNEASIAELTETFRSLGADADVRAIVLAGKGPAFCAGADLGWMKRMAGFSHDENRADAMKLATMLRTIYECPKPVIARVHGDAYAGGVGLVAVCDIAVAAIGSTLLPERDQARTHPCDDRSLCGPGNGHQRRAALLPDGGENRRRPRPFASDWSTIWRPRRSSTCASTRSWER